MPLSNAPMSPQVIQYSTSPQASVDAPAPLQLWPHLLLLLMRMWWLQQDSHRPRPASRCSSKALKHIPSSKGTSRSSGTTNRA